MHRIEDLHIRELTPLPAPREIQQALPLTEAVAQTVYDAREATKRILRHEDPRPLVIVGPCSIHDPVAAYEYAERLAELHVALRDRLHIVMRTYFEKPRTTTGWRGLINDPHLDGSFDMAEGLHIGRELLLRINTLGLPVATEMLDPISPQYISDLVSVTAIGARTTESQTHRALASGLSMPVGFKNSTDGSVQAAINACISARHAHSFLGITHEGMSAVVKTRGNPDCFVILRGSKGQTNFDAASVADAARQMAAADHRPAIMVDCSHANSNYEFARQEAVWDALIAQLQAERGALIGIMVESNLLEGKQAISADRNQMRYGVSVTDGCLGWDVTERMLRQAHAALARS